MHYRVTDIVDIIGADAKLDAPEAIIRSVSIDTRKVVSADGAIFFALRGTMTDGHDFLDEAYHVGVRHFVVDREVDMTVLHGANILKASDTLSALRSLASHHRACYAQLPTIGITGSNGKTIVKEWSYQMMHDRFYIIKSPKSYNSQLGMTLSILGIEGHHELGIFEAGVSLPGEMEKHHDMLKPQIGVMTNIGAAHDEGFPDRRTKIKEKLDLFRSADIVIYCRDHDLIHDVFTEVYGDSIESFTWGASGSAHLDIVRSIVDGRKRIITLEYLGEVVQIHLHLTDYASYENAMHCIAIMAYLGVPVIEWQSRVARVSGLPMRLEMTSGIEQSILINDAYTADIDSLRLAVAFVQEQLPDKQKIAVMSTFEGVGQSPDQMLRDIASLLAEAGYMHLYLIGHRSAMTHMAGLQISYYQDKTALIQSLSEEDIAQKAILIKGARKFRLEDVTRRLSLKGHSAILQIDLSAIEHNLRIYKSHLHTDTGIIAVIKASAYGSGSAEVARVLQNSGVDYLAVAFADEGIELRKSGVTLPIMVLNPDMRSLSSIVRYRLEPEVYTMGQLDEVIRYGHRTQDVIDIHIKVDSGMHRLGFLPTEMDIVSDKLSKSKYLRVASVFSHLASSEDEQEDAYTRSQFHIYLQMLEQLRDALGYLPKRHLLNSAGITRFSDMQLDYVRLGIGLYGIDGNPEINTRLTKAHRLTANLIQIKHLKAGAGVGYNRKTILERDTVVGVVNIGYADGLIRSVGNRKYNLSIRDAVVPILGNVCMDLTIVDLNSVPDPAVGDEVIIFDQDHPIEALAAAAETIPYEVLSRISSRVQRMFVRG